MTGVLQAWDTFKDEHSLCRAHGNITETEMAYIMSSASVVNVSSKLGFFSSSVVIFKFMQKQHSDCAKQMG